VDAFAHLDLLPAHLRSGLVFHIVQLNVLLHMLFAFCTVPQQPARMSSRDGAAGAAAAVLLDSTR
jgi:hypothetical protein